MADQADARNIALSLADTFEDPDKYAFGVLRRGRPTGIMWAWMERVDPKARKTPSRDVVAIRVAGEAEKAMLIAADPEKFVTRRLADPAPAEPKNSATYHSPHLRLP